MSPQPASKSTAPSAMGRAQRRPPNSAFPHAALSTTPATLSCPACSAGLFIAYLLNLSHLEHLNSGSGSCLDEAANTNTLAFQRLRYEACRLENSKRPPWNSHGKVSCPVLSEIQICDSPCLPDGQNLALDQRKSPDPGQNSAGTLGVFYGRGLCPDASFCIARRGFSSQQRCGAFFVRHIRRNQGLALREKFGLHHGFGRKQPDKSGLAAVAIR